MKGERNKALREFGFLFSKERDFFIYHFELGRIFEAWGEKDKAIGQYKRAQLLNPNFPAAGEAIKRLEGGSGSRLSGTSPPAKTTSSKR